MAADDKHCHLCPGLLRDWCLRPTFSAVVRHLKTYLTLALLSIAQPALCDTRAVLVGVGDYLHLDADLKGPVNDVAMMAATLEHRGLRREAIQGLSDPGAQIAENQRAGLPTRKAILQALTTAVDQSQPGDTIIFYFSGHGAQAPDQNGDEGGGWDECPSSEFFGEQMLYRNGGSGSVSF